MKKIAVAVLIFLLVAVPAAYFSYGYVYDAQIEKTLVAAGVNVSDEVVAQVRALLERKPPVVHAVLFECSNSPAQTTGYVFVRGYADHGAQNVQSVASLIDGPLLDFEYDETASLEHLSSSLASLSSEFAQTTGVDELIIIGHSAGGVIAAHAASQLALVIPVEIHTTAAPLRGYDAPDELIGSRGEYYGLGLEIGRGVEPFAAPAPDVQVYHHKTVEDDVLMDFCGPHQQLCNTLAIQDNNIGQDFYYANETHDSLLSAVAEKITDCRK